jgi:hypothetical protein
MRRRLFALVAAPIVLGGVLGTVALADGIIGPLDPPDPGLDRSADPTSSAGPPISAATPQEQATARLPCSGERNRQMLTPVPGRPESAGSDTTVAGDPAVRYDDGTATCPVRARAARRGLPRRCADDAHYCAGRVER